MTHDDDDDDGRGLILIGALWMAGGIIATVIGYSAAAPGGSYFIFWGAIIFGAVDIFRGMAKL